LRTKPTLHDNCCNQAIALKTLNERYRDITPINFGYLLAAYTSLMDRTFIDRKASEFERRRARDVAYAVLDGRTTVLEAVRELVSLAHTDAIADVEDRRLIIGIESETDDLPVGEARKLWAPDALKTKDVEIARCEELYRRQFLEACKRIAGRRVN
jgi:hypothetical protein